MSVKEIADIISHEAGLDPEYMYINKMNGRGWAGDVRKMLLSIKRARKLGWKPMYSSRKAIELAAKDSLQNNY